MRVDPRATGFVVEPLPFVDIAISMDQAALPISFVVGPVANVARPVDPNLLATTLTLVVLVPLTKVLGPVLKSKLRTLLKRVSSRKSGIEDKGRQSI